jgi:hypothetical protein
MYARGCRCEDCKQAEAAYKRARLVGQPTGLTVVPLVGPSPEQRGKTVEAVIAELATLPFGKVALAELAKVLAAYLDNPSLAASHSAAVQGAAQCAGGLPSG